ncbi:hypothetical protein M413DRAFT_226262 [Hebeloma cylindrosporum]|uniref:P-loop containing nucleoside triphosphate hydrolase protein n=1 Tax=Hebeloma cylindrosporum TaxID=76867 RepID=A0A0C2YEQ1_HEBCY|nr:hypothetical protein M413DRAFT_226262 [Hebeloma cylindrosporum h7]
MRCLRNRIPTPLQLVFRRNSSTVTPILLRPYQEQCLDACIDALDAGSTRIGVSLPTGSGKTTVFVSLLSRLASPSVSQDATRSIIVVNSIELARQSAEQVARLFPHWQVEIEQGAKHQASGLADVTVATYQTLNNEERLLKFDPRKLKAVVIDEAHHAAAPSYRRLLARFDPDIKHPDPDFMAPVLPHKIPIIGFSATFGRHDGLALGSVFERIVYHRDFLDMIKEQWLCDVRFTSVKAQINLQDVKINSRNGDFNPTSLAHVVNTEAINELVVRSWIDRAAKRRSTLVFCVNIAHVKELTGTFRRYGIDARYLYAGTPADERRALVQSFKNGEYPVLVNCAILTEGADIPNIDCVIVARPTRSRNLFAQMIGRGMRLSPQTGKEDCRIIDFVDNHARVGGVVSVPTIFGLDPNEFDLDDETISSLENRVLESEVSIPNGPLDIPTPRSVTFTEHHDPFSIENSDKGPRHIAALSHLSWVGCGGDIYVLELLTRGFVRIELDETSTHFVGSYTPALFRDKSASALKLSPYQVKRQILSAETLEDAVKGCETYVTSKVFKDGNIQPLLRSALWRQKPASDAQKTFISKRWTKIGSPLADPEREEKIKNMNKGEAATIITRLRNGSQVRIRFVVYGLAEMILYDT